MDPDLDDTRAAPLSVPAIDPNATDHDAPDLEDTVVTRVLSETLPELVEPLQRVEPARPEPSWPEPAWPAALDPVAAPAPVYSFRIGFDSQPVGLDTTVFVGRKPTPPRIPGVVHPRLITVESPRSEVSGTHVEIRQRGSSVIVTDLKSTNGTIVVIPGSAPRRMRQGESIVVSPGTFIDIGDGNLIEILATRLRYDEGLGE